jgi:hypothetical protein
MHSPLRITWSPQWNLLRARADATTYEKILSQKIHAGRRSPAAYRFSCPASNASNFIKEQVHKARSLQKYILLPLKRKINKLLINGGRIIK